MLLANKHCFLFLLAALAGAGTGLWLAPQGPAAPAALSQDSPGRPDRPPAKDAPRTGLSPQDTDRPARPAAPQKVASRSTAPSAASPQVPALPADPEQSAAMVKLLHSLRSSGEAGQPPGAEDKPNVDLKAALAGLLRHLRQSELARSVFSRRDTEGYISTLVKITPPSVTEINTLKRMLAELSGGLPPGQRMQFQNESLLLLRQFVFAQDKVLIVFLTEHFAQSPAKAGNFHTHLTSRPAEYWHHHNGEQLGVPAGESNYEAGPLPSPLSPAFRYYHLAANQ